MKKLLFFSTFLSLLIFGNPYYSYSQSVGVSGTGAVPDASALLDIDATGMSPKKGLLIPRLTTTERNAISGPAESLFIFNTTTKCYEGYVNGGWYTISCPSACTPPAGPVASAASFLSCTSFTTNWSASSGATSYYLDVATDAGFTTFVTGYNNTNVGNVNSSSVTGLSAGTAYYYRVRAYSACISGNSNTISLTTSVPVVTGGTLTSDATYYYRTFLASGTLGITGCTLTCDVLVIAGGGGSANYGGGGAGGLLYSAGQSFNSDQTVTVGAGGLGNPTPGANSSLGSLVATGGGTGGNPGGGNGGSGGGGGNGGQAGGTGTAGQGNNGGSNQGGGGGAGTAGGNGPSGSGGNGTNAYSSWATATSTGVGGYYAGGGGGDPAGAGGLGGGGNCFSNGTANTGGGAGGHTNGGSGIVIVRYTRAQVGG